MSPAEIDLEEWLLREAGRAPSRDERSTFIDCCQREGVSSASALAALAAIHPDAHIGRRAGRCYLRSDDAAARPRLRSLARGLPGDLGLSLDLPPTTIEQALEQTARRFGVPLETVRVRPGVGPARLIQLHFVVSEELLGSCAGEISARRSDLEHALQGFLEELLGDEIYEDWLGNLTLELIPPRPRALLVVADHSGDYPIQLTKELVDAARVAIEQESRLPNADAPWFALELPESAEPSAPQPRRRFASTCVPSALKSVLEGLPFHGRRFFPMGYELVTLEWFRRGGGDERALLDAVEGELKKAASFLLVGSGFGAERDYLDLLVPATRHAFESLLELLQPFELEGDLRFGRSDYVELSLRLRRGA